MIVKFTIPDSKLSAPSWRWPIAVWALWGLVCLSGGKAQAEITVDLVGPDLEAKRIILNSVEDSTMTFFDADGLLQVEPLANYLRWRVAPVDVQTKQGTVVVDQQWPLSGGLLSPLSAFLGAGAAQHVFLHHRNSACFTRIFD